MALNITNARAIAGVYGNDRNKWIGKSIQIYVGQVRNPEGRGTVDGLKIRDKIPTTGKEDLSQYEEAIKTADSIEALVEAWKTIPPKFQPRMNDIKEAKKKELAE